MPIAEYITPVTGRLIYKDMRLSRPGASFHYAVLGATCHDGRDLLLSLISSPLM